MSAPIEVVLPLALVNPTNSRAFWRARSTRVKRERSVTRLVLQAAGALPFFRETPAPWRVELVRRSPRAFDSDGLVAAFKGIRDEVAAIAGLDDKSPSFRWCIRWEKATKREVGVVVRVSQASEDAPLLEVA